MLAAFAEQAAIAVQSARLAHLLTQEKQRVESILEGSADGIYTVDADRRIVSVNPAMERLLGRPGEELLGLPCAVALNWRDREGRPICPGRCPMLHAHQANSGADGNVTEIAAAARSSTGQRAEVALVYSVVRSPEMAPLNAVVNVRDMTRVRETEQMRSTFLSMLEHQLQTPLAIIKGYTNTLSRPDAQWDSETLRRSFEAIEEETDRMSQAHGPLAAGIPPGSRRPAAEPRAGQHGRRRRKGNRTAPVHLQEARAVRVVPRRPAADNRRPGACWNRGGWST